MLDKTKLSNKIKEALKEDIGPLDITSSVLISSNINLKAGITVNDNGVICGLPICEMIFKMLDKEIKFKPQVRDGDLVHKEKVVCYLEGPARPILAGERTALNFLSRLSGIATSTHKFVERVRPYNVKIMDTRKTTPGLRFLEKYAVKVGGGNNHRMGLWDQVLIKDNHLKIKSIEPHPLNISEILRSVKKRVQKNIKIEVEVKDLEDFKEALKGEPDIVMLDNMSPEDVKRAIETKNSINSKKPLVEVSGNITLENVEEYAKCKPDFISVGSITHSFFSLDFTMEVYG